MNPSLTLLVLLAVTACSTATVTQHDAKAYRGHDVQVSAAGSAACPDLDDMSVATALKHTNDVRKLKGQRSLSPNTKLNRIAAQQACHMAKTGMMSHAGPQNEGPKHRAKAAGYAPRIIAENIAAGPYSLSQVLGEWDRSPAHLANSVLPPVTDFGIGTATGHDGTRYWTAVYAEEK